MKSYTDLSQSRKLAEILPLESADMEYLRLKETNAVISSVPFVKDELEVENSAYDAIYERSPCWSLAALINALPDELTDSDGDVYIIDISHSNGKYFIQYSKLPTLWPLLFSTKSDNLVDACYEMILKLHEQK